ncbi:hypothetical protein F5Y01DRAFT_91564 [Xylaria sp. FL0043]|nr:hypothetical protein F5Y01DRAFT_91564 [Xylaria sp. FL0043]
MGSRARPHTSPCSHSAAGPKVAGQSSPNSWRDESVSQARKRPTFDSVSSIRLVGALRTSTLWLLGSTVADRAMVPMRYIPPALLGTHTYLPKIHSRLCMDFAGPAVESPLCTSGSVLMVLCCSLSAPTNHQGGVFWVSVQHLISHTRPVPCPSSIVETPHHLNISMEVLLHSQSLLFFQFSLRAARPGGPWGQRPGRVPLR